jgi:hypothetical protein
MEDLNVRFESTRKKEGKYFKTLEWVRHGKQKQKQQDTSN